MSYIKPNCFITLNLSDIALANQKFGSIDSVSPSHIAKESWARCQGYAQDVAAPTVDRLEEWLALDAETAESGKIFGMS